MGGFGRIEKYVSNWGMFLTRIENKTSLKPPPVS